MIKPTVTNDFGGDHFSYIDAKDKCWHVRIFCSCESVMGNVKISKPNKVYKRNCFCRSCCTRVCWELILKE